MLKRLQFFVTLFCLSLLILTIGGAVVAQDVVEIETEDEGEMAELSGRVVVSFSGDRHPNLGSHVRRVHGLASGSRMRRGTETRRWLSGIHPHAVRRW